MSCPFTFEMQISSFITCRMLTLNWLGKYHELKLYRIYNCTQPKLALDLSTAERRRAKLTGASCCEHLVHGYYATKRNQWQNSNSGVFVLPIMGRARYTVSHRATIHNKALWKEIVRQDQPKMDDAWISNWENWKQQIDAVEATDWDKLLRVCGISTGAIYTQPRTGTCLSTFGSEGDKEGDKSKSMTKACTIYFWIRMLNHNSETAWPINFSKLAKAFNNSSL